MELNMFSFIIITLKKATHNAHLIQSVEYK